MIFWFRYDFEALEELSEDHLAIFVMATYGEGEPTDNAVGMLEYLKETPIDQLDLSKLKFVIFALGNRTYEQFCKMIKLVSFFSSSSSSFFESSTDLLTSTLSFFFLLRCDGNDY